MSKVTWILNRMEQKALYCHHRVYTAFGHAQVEKSIICTVEVEVSGSVRSSQLTLKFTLHLWLNKSHRLHLLLRVKIAHMTHLVKGCTQQYKRYSTYTSTIQPAERLIEGFPFKEFSKLIGRMKICLSYSQQAYQISSRDVHWSQKQRRCELLFFFFSFLKRL